MYVNRRHQKYR